MEKIERSIFGFCFLLGGVFLLIFIGVRLIDLLSKTILYFMLIFFIILMLYGVILILIATLIMSVNIRVKKSIALIIFLIGIVIIILSITVITIDFFTIVNIFEIFSGLGLIFLGIRLFFHKIKLKDEEKKKIEKKILGIIFFIIGLIISLSFGFSFIMTIVSFSPETVLHVFPFFLLPFLIGIVLLIFSKYSIKITPTTQERKIKVAFSILMGVFIILTSSFSIVSMINYTYYYIFYTPYFPLLFLFIGIVLILYGFYLQQTIRKRSLTIKIKS